MLFKKSANEYNVRPGGELTDPSGPGRWQVED